MGNRNLKSFFEVLLDFINLKPGFGWKAWHQLRTTLATVLVAPLRNGTGLRAAGLPRS